MIFSGYLCHIEENKHTKSYENKGKKIHVYGDAGRTDTRLPVVQRGNGIREQHGTVA